MTCLLYPRLIRIMHKKCKYRVLLRQICRSVHYCMEFMVSSLLALRSTFHI